MSVSLAQHRQLAAFNKHKNLETFLHRNCCTASDHGPTASGFRMRRYLNLKHQCRNTARKASCSRLSMLDPLCSNGHLRSFVALFLIAPSPNLYLSCTVCSSKLTTFSARGVTCITAMLLGFLSDA